jgi:Reverse transcriptase (RNA-dependent DNA polymerase)
LIFTSLPLGSRAKPWSAFFEAMAPLSDNSKRTGAAIEAHYRFLAWLVPTIEKFPKSHKFTIGDRIETIALDVLEALIEATYTRERMQIDHAILKFDFRRRAACRPTLALLDLIVDRSNAQEPVQLYFDGDDLFAPLQRRRGLPIGNLTSQFFANLYLDGFDHFVTEILRASYVRYVDDFALFHDDPTVLAGWRLRIEQYLAGRRLKLHPRKTMILSCTEPWQFLGFELHADGGRRLPEDNVRRFRNRLRGLRDRWRMGTIGFGDVNARVGAWVAHAEHADTWRLRHAIFRGGRFDPATTLEAWTAPCRRVLRGNSWNNNPQNLRSANRNRNTTDNRNNNNGFRVGSTLSARAGAITVASGEH